MENATHIEESASGESCSGEAVATDNVETIAIEDEIPLGRTEDYRYEFDSEDENEPSSTVGIETIEIEDETAEEGCRDVWLVCDETSSDEEVQEAGEVCKPPVTDLYDKQVSSTEFLSKIGCNVCMILL